jgi:hypothetical protein
MKQELVDKAKELGIDISSFGDDESKVEAAIKEKENSKDTNDDDDDDDDKDKEYWKNEAKKAFQDRDEAKKERRRLAENIKKLETQLKGAPKSDEIDELRKELKELKDAKAELDKAKEDEELKNKTESEKLELNFKKQMETFKKQMEEELNKNKKVLEDTKSELGKKDSEINNLRQHRLKSEIMEVATKLKAYSPSQVYKLLRDDFTYDPDLDKFWFYMKDDKGKLVEEKTIEERVKEFLTDPDNDNLVEADVSVNRNNKSDDKDKSKDKKKVDTTKYNPKDPKIIKEADDRGFKVEEWIAIKTMRDEKLAKKK